MSEPTGLSPDDAGAETIAGELALGLLDADDRTAAMRRMLNDRAFADEVERWRRRLGPLVEDWPARVPPTGLLDRIEASISGRAVAAPRRWGWPIVSAILGAAAAVIATLTVTHPAPPAGHAPRTALLAASIQPSSGGGSAIVALYDPVGAAVRIGASPIEDRAHSAELWVIAGKAPPRAIGLMAGAHSTLTLASPAREAMAAGATLAISREPAGGSPTELPTGPVIASGVLLPV